MLHSRLVRQAAVPEVVQAGSSAASSCSYGSKRVSQCLENHLLRPPPSGGAGCSTPSGSSGIGRRGEPSKTSGGGAVAQVPQVTKNPIEDPASRRPFRIFYGLLRHLWYLCRSTASTFLGWFFPKSRRSHNFVRFTSSWACGRGPDLYRSSVL